MEEQRPQTGAPPSDASSPLAALLSNPALLQGIGAMLKGNASPPAETQADVAPTAETAASAPTLDPQMLSRLPQMMSVLSALQKPLPPTPTGDREAAREALLCALKPFLSPSRAEAIDALLRLLRLSRAMGQFR